MIVSELTLNGILHLFALLSSCYHESGPLKARDMVKAYLSDYLRIVHTDTYLGLFDGFFDFYDGDSDLDLLITRTTEICGHLKGNLPRPEQYAVLLRFFELSQAVPQAHRHELSRLADAAGHAFEIRPDVIKDMLALLHHTEAMEALGPNHLFIHSKKPCGTSPCQWLVREHFTGGVTVLHIEDIDTLFLVPHTLSGQTLNGIPLHPGAIYPLPTGSILKDIHSNPIYYSDIAAFFKPLNPTGEILFTGHHIDFRFPGSDNGLHDFCFQATGGQMIGVMGGSGVGKSTLLSLLNGSLPPQEGQVLINGADLYCLLYTSPSPRDVEESRMPSSA